MNDLPGTYLVKKENNKEARSSLLSSPGIMTVNLRRGVPTQSLLFEQRHLALPDEKGRQGAARWTAVDLAHCEVAGI